MLYLIALYAGLIEPEFDKREAASDALLHLIDRHPSIYGPRLSVLVRESTEPEIKARTRRHLAAFDRWRVASYIPSTVPVWPCIDFYPVANPFVPFGIAPDLRDKGAAWEWLCRASPPGVTGGPECGPCWPRYRRGTDELIRQMLFDGATAEQCDVLLSRMWTLEQAGKSDCGEKWAESATWTRWQGGFPRPKEAP